MIKISLILALRGQFNIFNNLMDSLVKTTSDPSTIEIVVVIDSDDRATYEFAKGIEIKYKSFNFQIIVTKRSCFFIRDYYNFAERQSFGRWVMNINADSLFMTKNWDIILNNKMNDASLVFGDDILFGIIKDGLPRINDGKEYPKGVHVFCEEIRFSCWTLSSREFIHLMGGIMDERIAAWGADSALGDLFDLIDGGKRKVFIPEVFVDHISHHINPNIPISEHYKTFARAVEKYGASITKEQLQESARRVNEYLDRKHK